MNFFENVQVATKNLKANKTRSLLSMLGIVIGTGSVIVVISVVNGNRLSVLSMMQAGRENVLIVRPKFSMETKRFGKLSLSDVDHLRQIPHVLTAYPAAQVEEVAGGTAGKAQAKAMGIDSSYPRLFHLKLQKGRFFTSLETDARPRLCLLTDKMARKLFGFDDPLLQRVRFKGMSLQVTGVFQSEENARNQFWSPDILIPVNTLIGSMEEYFVQDITVRVEPNTTDRVKESIRNLIASNKKEDIIDIEDPRENAVAIQNWSRGLFLQMTLIAGVSLLVGGIGLMNVMLISVTERTHEIGIRKAVGASSKMLLQQFLVESVTLSGLGGLCGILLGLVVSYGIGVLSKGKIPTCVVPLSVLVSFLFASLIGILFGLFPASKAAQLSPVEALRYE